MVIFFPLKFYNFFEGFDHGRISWNIWALSNSAPTPHSPPTAPTHSHPPTKNDALFTPTHPYPPKITHTHSK